MTSNLTVADYGIVSKLTKELHNLTKLPSVNVIPAEIVGYSAWENAGSGDYEPFNAELGRACAEIVCKQWRQTLTLATAREEGGRLRIGVAGGQTTYALVEQMERINAGRNQVEISPLVLGAVPRHRYSAGTIADILAQKFLVSRGPELPEHAELGYAKLENIEEWTPNDDSYRVSLRHDVADQRRIIKRDGNKTSIERVDFYDFDYVLLGIGRFRPLLRGSNIAAQIRTLYSDAAPENLLGDICSRLYDGDGKEIDPSVQDPYVAISFGALRWLVRLRRDVVVVAGGPDKVDAIGAIIKGHMEEPLINGLITDELTATALRDWLSPRRRATPNART